MFPSCFYAYTYALLHNQYDNYPSIFMNYHWSHYFGSVNIQSPVFDNICVLLMKETQQNQNNDNNDKNFN